MSADKIIVPVDEKLAALIWRLHGLAMAFDALGSDKPKSTLPGFLLAHAIIEKEVAEMRAQMAGAVYRAAAKAGHDVSNAKSIYTTVHKGKPVVELDPADLVDQPED